MIALGKKDKKKHPIRLFLEFTLVIVLVTYVTPAIKNAFFPTEEVRLEKQLNRIEKMLRKAVFHNYTLVVERPKMYKLILTIRFHDAPLVTSVIYYDLIRELEPTGDSRIFFAYSINENTDGLSDYLAQTLIITDADLKQVKRIEVSRCDRMATPEGEIKFKGHEPVYECEVPVKEVVCLTKEPED